MIDFGNLAMEVFQTMRAFNYDAKLYDAAGNSVLEPRDTRRFFSKAEDLGVVLIEDAENSTLKVIKSNAVPIGEIQGFTRTLKSLSDRYSVLFSIEGQDGPIKPRDFTRFNVGESREENMDLTETMYGTSRSSYLKLKNARLIVKHSDKVDESRSGARSRHIDRMFVENSRGERRLLPTRSLAAGKAMAQHVSHGGEIDDEKGSCICEMAKDYDNLGSVIRHVRKNGNVLTEAAASLKDCATKERSRIRNVFEKIHRNYFNGSDQMGYNTLYEDDVLAECRAQVAEALTVEGVELEEAILETMARCKFNLEKEPLEEKAENLMDVCGTNVSVEVFLDFAKNDTLHFASNVPDLSDVDIKNDDDLGRAMGILTGIASDHGIANLFSNIGEQLLAGNATTLARQIAARAVKIAKSQHLASSLKNDVIVEHIDWLESFTVENVLLGESKDEECSCKGKCMCEIDEDDNELSREDVVLPKSSSADLRREVIKRPQKEKTDTSRLLLDDEEE